MRRTERAAKTRLLRDCPGFRAYWIARGLSVTGDQLAKIALVTLIYELQGTAVAVSVLLLALTIPRLFGPLAGTLADRVSTRALMIGADLGQAAIFVALAWTSAWPVICLLVSLSALGATIYQPAGRSNVPGMVPADQLVKANALLAAASNGALAIGPAVGGVLIAATGPRAALLANAGTFGLSALMTTRIPKLRHGDERGALGPLTVFGLARSGYSVLRTNVVARSVAILLFVSVAFASLDSAALIFLVRHSFHAASATFAWVVTAYSMAMVAAPLAFVRLKRSARSVLAIGEGAFGVGTLASGLAPDVVAGVASQAIAGAGNGLENVATDTLLQQNSSSAELGAVFGTVYTAPYLGQIVAFSLATPLIITLGPRLVFVIAGAGVLLTLVLVLLRIRLPADNPALSPAPKTAATHAVQRSPDD